MTDGLPPVLFYLAGLLGWSYFAQIFQSTSGTLINNSGLFGKVYFPRLVVPLSAVISNLLAFFLQLGTFLLLLVIILIHRRRILRPQPRGLRFPVGGAADRSAQPRRWPLALGTDGQIPRLHPFERLHHPDLDVPRP